MQSCVIRQQRRDPETDLSDRQVKTCWCTQVFWMTKCTRYTKYGLPGIVRQRGDVSAQLPSRASSGQQ